MLRILTPWDSQPQEQIGSAADLNPWALFNFANGLAPRNYGPRSPGGLSWTIGSTNVTRVSSAGIGLSGGTTVSGMPYGANRSFDAMSPASSPAWFALSFTHEAYLAQGSSSNVIFTLGTPDSGSGFFADVTSTNVFRVWCCNTTLTGPTLTAGRKYNIVFGRDSAGACWLWIDGALYTSGTGATAAVSATARRLALVGDDAPNTTRSYQGSIALLAMGSENPSAFGAQLSANPWSLFAPRSIWVPVSVGAGGAYTLTALAGAYTVAGQSATLVRGRSAAAAAGAYSLSGQAASLSIGHTLTAAAGAYSLSGQSATLVRGRVLAAGAGAYSLSGQNATITYTPAGSYTLTANAGAYTLSGQATTIAWGRALAAASGSYALSGQAATITYAPANAYTLTCVAGAYAISGQAATVTWSGEAVTTTLRRGFAGFPRSHLWIAHINGKRYVGTYEELEEALGEVVEKTARKPRVVIKSGRVVSRGVAQPAVATVEQAKIVQQQLTVDIGPLLAAAVRRRDEEEEEDLMLLL